MPKTKPGRSRSFVVVSANGKSQALADVPDAAARLLFGGFYKLAVVPAELADQLSDLSVERNMLRHGLIDALRCVDENPMEWRSANPMEGWAEASERGHTALDYKGG
jgi:hypothetical protein